MTSEDVISLRDSMKLSRDKFAERLGVTPLQIWRWEKGRTKPSPMASILFEQVKSEFLKSKLEGS